MSKQAQIVSKLMRRRGFSSLVFIQFLDFLLFHPIALLSSPSSSISTSWSKQRQIPSLEAAPSADGIRPEVTPGTALGWFISEGVYFVLMHDSIRVPRSRMEPCQLLLPGPDAIFIIVNCRKEEERKKKGVELFVVAESLQFSTASAGWTSCGFSSNRVIDGAGCLQCSQLSRLS